MAQFGHRHVWRNVCCLHSVGKRLCTQHMNGLIQPSLFVGHFLFCLLPKRDCCPRDAGARQWQTVTYCDTASHAPLTQKPEQTINIFGNLRAMWRCWQLWNKMRETRFVPRWMCNVCRCPPTTYSLCSMLESYTRANKKELNCMYQSISPNQKSSKLHAHMFACTSQTSHRYATSEQPNKYTTLDYKRRLLIDIFLHVYGLWFSVFQRDKLCALNMSNFEIRNCASFTDKKKKKKKRLVYLITGLNSALNSALFYPGLGTQFQGRN